MSAENPLREIQEQIKSLLAKDKIEEALNMLIKHLKSHEQLNKVVVQSAMFKRMNEALTQNTVDWEKASITKNQLIVSILSIVDST